MKKRLVKHGNSRALVFDKTLLELLGINEDNEVVLTVQNGSLIITSAKTAEEERSLQIKKSYEELEKKYRNALEKLAK